MNSFKTSKKFFAVLIVITLLLALNITASAKNPSVVDSAGLFTESQKASIEAKVEETISITGVDIVIVTTNDTKGKTSEAYSDDYFDYNGYGLGEERNGILLLINMGDREIHISLRGSGTDFFSDTNIENALDFMSPYASKGQYEKAVEYFLMDVQGLYNASINNPDDGNNEYYGYGQFTEVYPYDQEAVVSPEPEKESQPPDTTSVIIAAIVVGLIAGGIVCLLVASKYKMKLGGYQYPFRANSSVNMTVKTDTLVDRRVTQQRISDDNDRNNNNRSSGSGGGSRINVSIGSSHVSSSGASHRGSTRGF